VRRFLYNAHVYKMASFLGRMGRWSFNSRSVLQRRFMSSESSSVEIDCNAEGNRRLLIAAITLPITLYLVSNELLIMTLRELNSVVVRGNVLFVCEMSFVD